LEQYTFPTGITPRSFGITHSISGLFLAFPIGK
jgi:hypothetical protein